MALRSMTGSSFSQSRTGSLPASFLKNLAPGFGIPSSWHWVPISVQEGNHVQFARPGETFASVDRLALAVNKGGASEAGALKANQIGRHVAMIGLSSRR